MSVIAAGAVVVDGRVCRPGWLQVAGTRIAACGPGAPPRPADLDLPDALLVPGFIDIHVHGGGGADYADGADGADGAATWHRRHGTTTTLASLVTAAPGALLDQVRSLAESTRRGAVAGIHLEGPWLAAARCGAHDHRQLRAPDPGEIDTLLCAGDGTIRMVTLAPELPGALDAIRRLVDAGVVVAVGHTDADYQQTVAAIEAGATVGTHLFNAMRPVHHREPGPVPALLADQRVTVELIADGVHVHPALLRQVIATAGPERVAAVTDAMAAAGCGDGAFTLGGRDVEVTAGVARLRGASTLAGSTAGMDRLFATVAGLAADPDAGLLTAVQLTAGTPARALGLPGVGALRAGGCANLVALDRDLEVTKVMVDGDWLAVA